MTAREIISRLSAIFRPGCSDAELDEEIRTHVEMATEENIRNGMNSDDARQAALRSFGWIEPMKETYRDRRGIPFVESLVQDVRFTVRTFGKYRGFTIAAIVTLALSIGIGTAIFSIVYALLIQPPPYDDPERLVMLWSTNQAKGIDLATAQRRGRSMDLQEVMDWKREFSVFDSLVAFEGWAMPVVGPGKSEELFVYAVSDGFLKTVGVQPLIGRGFLPEELKPGGNSGVLLLTHDYWESAFGADPKVLGTNLSIGKTREKLVQPYKIIGVLPPGFKFYHRKAVAFVPLHWGMDQRTRRGQKVMARLKPGVPLEQAQERTNIFSHQLARKYPAANKGWSVKLVPVNADAVASFRPLLRVLIAAVAIVLLIACSNVAAFLLIKLDARSHELALRCVLGASKRRVMRQVLTENLVLSGAGGLLGLGLAWLLIRYVHYLDLGASSFARHLIGLESIAINGPVATFAVVMTTCSGLLFALIPAWRALTSKPSDSLVVSGDRATVGVRGRWLRDAVVAAEVGLAVVLVVATGLLTRSLAGLLESDLGFTSSNLVYVSLPRVHFDVLARLQRETSSKEEFESATSRWLSKSNQEVIERVTGIPGVESAGIGGLLLNSGGSLAPVEARGSLSNLKSDAQRAYWRIVSTGGFRTLRVPLLRGRFFDEFDSRRSVPVAVVNEALADRLWPGEDPISREFTAWGEMSFVVIGVVGNMRHLGPRGPQVPAFFWNDAQNPSKNLTLVVRSKRDPADLVPEIRRQAAEADPTLVFRKAETVEYKVLSSEWQLHYSLFLLGGLSIGALVLALVGVYGTLNHVVSQRTREIGLRIALGANRGEVMRMVVYKGLAVVGAGVAVGVLGAVLVTRFLESFLFGVQPLDGATFTAVSVGFLLAAVLASYFPARRASFVDPMVSLRNE